MAGYANDELRHQVARLLKRKDGADRSDREVAGELDCSRHIVRVVRAFLIARGEIEPPKSRPHFSDGAYNGGPVRIRGGYVLDAGTGNVVRETDYRRRPRSGRATKKVKA